MATGSSGPKVSVSRTPPPELTRRLTVRDMMTHHAGIPGDLFNGLFSTAPDSDYSAKLLDWLSRDAATFPPNYKLSYSNTAFALLKEVIESASGSISASAN